MIAVVSPCQKCQAASEATLPPPLASTWSRLPSKRHLFSSESGRVPTWCMFGRYDSNGCGIGCPGSDRQGASIDVLFLGRQRP